MFLTLFLLAASAQAAPATDASVEKLLTVTKAESLAESISAQMDAMKERLQESVSGDKGSADPKQKEFREELDKLTADFKKENLSFAAMKPDLVKIYRESWTEEEIQDLIKFYETPTGKKTIETMPQMMQKTMMMVQNKMQGKIPPFQEKVKALVDKYHPEAAAGGETPKKKAGKKKK